MTNSIAVSARAACPARITKALPCENPAGRGETSSNARNVGSKTSSVNLVSSANPKLHPASTAPGQAGALR